MATRKIGEPARLARSLIQISELLNRRVARIFGQDEKLKTVEVRIIVNLGATDATSIGDLSRCTRLDKAWISRTIRALSDRGIVETDRQGDQGAKRIKLTAKGRQVRERIMPRLEAEWEQVTRGIDVRLAAQMLEIVLRNLSETTS